MKRDPLGRAPPTPPAPKTSRSHVGSKGEFWGWGGQAWRRGSNARSRARSRFFATYSWMGGGGGTQKMGGGEVRPPNSFPLPPQTHFSDPQKLPPHAPYKCSPPPLLLCGENLIFGEGGGEQNNLGGVRPMGTPTNEPHPPPILILKVQSHRSTTPPPRHPINAPHTPHIPPPLHI